MAGTASNYSLAVGLEKVYNNPSGIPPCDHYYAGQTHSLMILVSLPGDEKKNSSINASSRDNLEQIIDSDEKKRYEDEDELSDKITEILKRIISDGSIEFHQRTIC